MALRKAKSSSKRAARGAWEREPGTTEYGRDGGGSMGRGGKKGKAARVAVEPWASTSGKAAVERALPPEAERIEAAKSVREALTCLPEDMVLAMDVMGEGAPRGGVPDKQAGMVPFSSLMMERRRGWAETERKLSCRSTRDARCTNSGSHSPCEVNTGGLIKALALGRVALLPSVLSDRPDRGLGG